MLRLEIACRDQLGEPGLEAYATMSTYAVAVLKYLTLSQETAVSFAWGSPNYVAIPGS